MNKNSIKIIENIKRKIDFYLPQRLNQQKIKYFINKIKFNFDLNALNKNFNEPARDFLFRGGKRWRPILFLLTVKLFGKNYKKYLNIAAAIEIAHNATLIIDDIEDNSLLRRNEPTCHIKFGLDTALNTGILLHFIPLKILLKSNLPSKQLQKISSIYIEEIINVHFGQTIDIYWHKKFPQNINISQYMEMCRLKTGGLVKMPLRIACALAQKNKNTEKQLSHFGELIAIAFQIKDDVLDLIDNKNLGKTFGNDITEGKISFPVILALKKLTSAKSKRLIQILKIHTRDKKLISEAIELINKSGAIEESLKFANKLIDKAWQNIENILPQNSTKEEFKKFILSLTKRI